MRHAPQISSTLQFIVCLISLTFVLSFSACKNKYYRLCDNDCVMLGSYAGTTYDAPCADNVSFMVTHIADGRSFCDYMNEFGSLETLPPLPDIPSSMAMHEPLYPKMRDDILQSDPISFTLTEFSRPIVSSVLYIRKVEVSGDGILSGTYRLSPIDNATADVKVSWNKNAGLYNRNVERSIVGFDLGTSTPSNIQYSTSVNVTDRDMIIFISYKFEVIYEAVAALEESLEDRSETTEVTFTLQNFHRILPDYPAPVYCQGAREDLIDVVFIPANNHRQYGNLSSQVMSDFHDASGLILKEMFFPEPTLRFWRSQFNFWSNYHEGTANNYEICHECCHNEPDFYENIDEEIDFKVLLHKEEQTDLADGCNELFSASMTVDDDNAFIHELGHAAFELRDEYAGGWNGQEFYLNLPNNWNSESAAEGDAVFRHKQPSDAKKLK